MFDIHPPRSSHYSHQIHPLVVHSSERYHKYSHRFVLGFIVALICRPPPSFSSHRDQTAFGNTGNISIAVVSSVCHNEDNPFGDTCYDGVRLQLSHIGFQCSLHYRLPHDGAAIGVKATVFGSDAPLDFIADSMAIISEAMVPAVMLVFGGMLRKDRMSRGSGFERRWDRCSRL
ncbi:hypothetical protein F3Y22_tig00112738pilonHSYRG00343 [Hibiscus syriacus]|uniref:Uncharacterized protein n=1 Tax=Hibiscus syriacus TaxID=106335 RepID=A0A6A2WTU5_HIBSY|nr:hypothetical protein F3Y22_tig00112738pilonHSYRG00343 [Hibiscus syriacus]